MVSEWEASLVYAPELLLLWFSRVKKKYAYLLTNSSQDGTCLLLGDLLISWAVDYVKKSVEGGGSRGETIASALQELGASDVAPARPTLQLPTTLTVTYLIEQVLAVITENGGNLKIVFLDEWDVFLAFKGPEALFCKRAVKAHLKANAGEIYEFAGLHDPAFLAFLAAVSPDLVLTHDDMDAVLEAARAENDWNDDDMEKEEERISFVMEEFGLPKGPGAAASAAAVDRTPLWTYNKRPDEDPLSSEWPELIGNVDMVREPLVYAKYVRQWPIYAIAYFLRMDISVALVETLDAPKGGRAKADFVFYTGSVFKRWLDADLMYRSLFTSIQATECEGMEDLWKVYKEGVKAHTSKAIENKGSGSASNSDVYMEILTSMAKMNGKDPLDKLFIKTLYTYYTTKDEVALSQRGYVYSIDNAGARLAWRCLLAPLERCILDFFKVAGKACLQPSSNIPAYSDLWCPDQFIRCLLSVLNGETCTGWNEWASAHGCDGPIAPLEKIHGLGIKLVQLEKRVLEEGSHLHKEKFPNLDHAMIEHLTKGVDTGAETEPPTPTDSDPDAPETGDLARVDTSINIDIFEVFISGLRAEEKASDPRAAQRRARALHRRVVAGARMARSVVGATALYKPVIVNKETHPWSDLKRAREHNAALLAKQESDRVRGDALYRALVNGEVPPTRGTTSLERLREKNEIKKHQNNIKIDEARLSKNVGDLEKALGQCKLRDAYIYLLEAVEGRDRDVDFFQGFQLLDKVYIYKHTGRRFCLSAIKALDAFLTRTEPEETLNVHTWRRHVGVPTYLSALEKLSGKVTETPPDHTYVYEQLCAFINYTYRFALDVRTHYDLNDEEKDEVNRFIQRLGFRVGGSLATSVQDDVTRWKWGLQNDEDASDYVLLHWNHLLRRSAGGSRDARVLFKPDKWQCKVLDALDARRSALVQAPTGAGKTFISFYVMDLVLRYDDIGVCVYVAPNKSLAQQVAHGIRGRFNQKTYKQGAQELVCEVYSQFYTVKPTKSQLIITYPDILLAMLESNTALKEKIRYVIFDEVHVIGDDSGVFNDSKCGWRRPEGAARYGQSGAVYQSISKCIHLLGVPFLALSATIDNIRQFHKWLGDANGSYGIPIHLSIYTERYCDLNVSVCLDMDTFGINSWLCLSRDALKAGATLKLLPRDSVLLWGALGEAGLQKHFPGMAPKDYFDGVDEVTKARAGRYADSLVEQFRAFARSPAYTQELHENLQTLFKLNLHLFEQRATKLHHRHYFKFVRDSQDPLYGEVQGCWKNVDLSTTLIPVEKLNVSKLSGVPAKDSTTNEDEAIEAQKELDTSAAALQNYLTNSFMNNRRDLTSDFDYLDKFVKKLDGRGLLPLLIFNFNRGVCDAVLAGWLAYLEDSQRAYFFGTPERTAATRLINKQRRDAHLAAVKAQAAARAGKGRAVETQKAALRRAQSEGARAGNVDDRDDLRAGVEEQEMAVKAPEPVETESDVRWSYVGVRAARRHAALIEEALGRVTAIHKEKRKYDVLLRALRRGIGVHHTGLNLRYRAAVEVLYRLGYIRIIISTQSLSLGVNMPCRTAMFAHDHLDLNSLLFRQTAGRAGRRTYDLRGDVLLFQLARTKVRALLTAQREDLCGTSNGNPLMMLNLLHNVNWNIGKNIYTSYIDGASMQGEGGLYTDPTYVNKKYMKRLAYVYDKMIFQHFGCVESAHAKPALPEKRSINGQSIEEVNETLADDKASPAPKSLLNILDIYKYTTLMHWHGCVDSVGRGTRGANIYRYVDLNNSTLIWLRLLRSGYLERSLGTLEDIEQRSEWLLHVYSCIFEPIQNGRDSQLEAALVKRYDSIRPADDNSIQGWKPAVAGFWNEEVRFEIDRHNAYVKNLNLTYLKTYMTYHPSKEALWRGEHSLPYTGWSWPHGKEGVRTKSPFMGLCNNSETTPNSQGLLWQQPRCVGLSPFELSTFTLDEAPRGSAPGRVPHAQLYGTSSSRVFNNHSFLSDLYRRGDLIATPLLNKNDLWHLLATNLTTLKRLIDASKLVCDAPLVLATLVAIYERLQDIQEDVNA